jgi:hypothetical protein
VDGDLRSLTDLIKSLSFRIEYQNKGTGISEKLMQIRIFDALTNGGIGTSFKENVLKDRIVLGPKIRLEKVVTSAI